MRLLTSYTLVFILSIFLLSACCSEKDTYYMWKIENNTADTIKIRFTNRLDSVIVLPFNQYGKLKDINFTCGADFEENTYTIVIAGNKKLKKQLHLANNWERTTSVRQIYCDQTKKCIFVVNPKDIE